MSRASQDRSGQVEIDPASSQSFIYVPRSKQLVPSSSNSADADNDTIPNPISPISSAYFLYVPRAHIIVPYGQAPPSVTFYILAEDEFDLATEDGGSFLRLE